jgi:DNA-binding transcriptional regulator YdaS (Cro superfamily)
MLNSMFYVCRMLGMNQHIVRAIEHFGSATAMASAVGVSVQLVAFWRDGKRGVQPLEAALIERETGGEVTRRDLFPNSWHAIWPELVTDEHPAPVAAEAGRKVA